MENWSVADPQPQDRASCEEGLAACADFPELRPYLEAACDKAAEGAEYVITRYRDANANANLRTQLLRITAHAGLLPWPKLFQNLRSTRETELAETFPLHIVTA